MDGGSVLLHRISEGRDFLLWQHVKRLTQHLHETCNDVERRTYLERHIMNECSLSLVGFLNHLIGRQELVVTILHFLIHLFDAVDMVVDGLLHRDEAVLQLSHHILTLGLRKHLVVVSCRDEA